MCSQPIWEFVSNLGDASPLEHGGLFLYRDTTGVYDFEMERIELTTEGEDSDEDSDEGDDAGDDDGSRWTVQRVCLDRCKLVRDGTSVYLVPFAYAADWTHPVHQYQQWFVKDLGDVADTMGTTRIELETALCHDDGALRAWAYQCIADYHGWNNFDSDPLTLTRADIEARYVKGELGEGFRPTGAVSLRSEHLRPADYSFGKVRLPNCHGQAKWMAEPGDLIEFAYPNGSSRFARVLGRVDAPSDGPTVPARVGFLAVLELGQTGHSAFIRWIDPSWVSSCTAVPAAMLAWFFAPTLPGLPAIVKLDSLGSLSNRYIGRYAGACEACIVEHGLFDRDRPCTHKSESNNDNDETED